MSLACLRHLPVKRKLTLIVLTACSIILLLACAVLFAFQLVLFKDTAARHLAVLAQIVVDNAAGPVSLGDKKAADEILSSLTSQPDILSARIVLASGRELAAAGPGVDEDRVLPHRWTEDVRYEGQDMFLAQRITQDRDVVGTLYLHSDIRDVRRALLLRYAFMLGLVLAGSFVIAFVLSARLQRFITIPILKLAEVARVVAERRDYSVRAEKVGDDELGLFTDTFNQMLVRIESQDRALRDSEEKFRQLAENVREVFWITSADMREVIYVSPAYQEVWGRSVDDLYRRPQEWAEAILPEDRPRVLEACRELASQRPSFDLEYRVRRQDGTVRWIRDRGSQVLDDHGQVYRTAGVASDITEHKEAEAAIENMHKQLVDASRQAGMAEVATGVLHNVGNVLNSVNVTATLITDRIKKSSVADLARVMGILREHATDLGSFLTTDSRGRKVPEFLAHLVERLTAEQGASLKELQALREHIDHIKEIVAMQQSYAKVAGVTETVRVTDLVEDALRLNTGALQRHDVTVARDYVEVAPIITEKHKVLQILVNFIRNAKYACDESGRQDKKLTIGVRNGQETVKIFVTDNGVGIRSENLKRIFNHGFTTRQDGHGFGLHSGALAAKELGGSLHVSSDGPGAGATFTLELPCQPIVSP
jgi:PAS domain S-box-containing protein